MPRLVRPTTVWLIAAFACAGCGRFGFGLLTDSEEVDPEGHNARLDAGAPVPALDSGAAPALDAAAAPALDSGANAARDAGPPRLPPGSLDCASIPGSVFCANFDDDMQPPSTRSSEFGAGDLRFRNGAMVAKISDGSAGDHAMLEITLPASDHWYLRTRVWIPSGFAIEELNFAAFGSRFQPDGADIDFNLVGNRTFQVYFDETRRAFDFGVGPFPRDQWLCLEARMTIDERNGAVSASFAGNSGLTVSPVDSTPPMGVDELRVGIDWADPNQAAAELRFDDILLSTIDYAGCP